MSDDPDAPPDLQEGQRWYTATSLRPARVIHEISEATGWVDFADRRGVRNGCTVPDFLIWVRRWGARVG